MAKFIGVYGSARDYAERRLDRMPNDIDVVCDWHLSEEERALVYQWAKKKGLPSGLRIDETVKSQGFLSCYSLPQQGRPLWVKGCGPVGIFFYTGPSGSLRRCGEIDAAGAVKRGRRSPERRLDDTSVLPQLHGYDTPSTMASAYRALLRQNPPYKGGLIWKPYFPLLKKWMKEPSYWPEGWPDKVYFGKGATFFVEDSDLKKLPYPTEEKIKEESQ